MPSPKFARCQNSVPIRLNVDGKPVAGLADLYRKVWAAGTAGVNVRLSILNRVEPREVTVHTGDRNKFLMMKPRKTI